MSHYHIVLFIHLLGVFFLLAGAGIANATGIAMTRTTKVSSIRTLAKINYVAGTYVIAPAALVLLLAGLDLVHTQGYKFSSLWIVLSLILWVVAMSIGKLILGRHAKSVLGMATEFEAQGVSEQAELTALATKNTGEVFGTINNLIIVAFLVLMVWRPT